MSRFLLGCLALFALALMVGQAVADANNQANNPAENNGVLIIETYTASANVHQNDMQPLPGNPGVEVAPDNANSDMNAQPVMVEEDMTVQETSD